MWGWASGGRCPDSGDIFARRAGDILARRAGDIIARHATAGIGF